MSDVVDFPLNRSWVDAFHAYTRDPEDPENLASLRPLELATEGFFNSSTICTDVKARRNSMFEVGIFLIGVPEVIGPREYAFPPVLKLRITRQVAGTRAVGQFLYDRSFREVWVSRGAPETRTWQAEIALDLGLVMETLDEWGGTQMFVEAMKEEAYAFIDIFDSLELLVVARRIDDYCTLSASVSGDLNQHFFGDVAYFNTSREYVKKGMMVGSMGETQTQEDVAGFGTMEIAESPERALDLAVTLGLIDEDEADEAREDLEETQSAESEADTGEQSGFAEWAREELRADDPSEGDNFGLNLADLKLDVTPKTDEGATAMFAGGLTLTLSGRVDISEFDVGPQQDEAPRRITVTPSTMTATVGLSDKGGDRIPFEMKEGSPLQGTIEVSKDNVDFIIGSLAVELETKGVYTLEGVATSPRKLKILVTANFGARRGSLSCGQ